MTRVWMSLAAATVAVPLVLERAPATRTVELTAWATLKDAGGASMGAAVLDETPHGVRLTVDLRGLPPGTRGFHIHETGRCDPPTFDSAGDHFAPDGRAHGIHDEGGPHAGDLPNLHVPADGQLTVEYFVPDVTLRHGPQSLLDGDGTALVVHAEPDDYRTDPAGEAGDRIACGVIRP